MSQQAVSAVIFQNSARVPQKLKSLKTLGPLFLMIFTFLSVRVEFFKSSPTVYILLRSSACYVTCVTSRHYLPLLTVLPLIYFMPGTHIYAQS